MDRDLRSANRRRGHLEEQNWRNAHPGYAQREINCRGFADGVEQKRFFVYFKRFSVLIECQGYGDCFPEERLQRWSDRRRFPRIISYAYKMTRTTWGSKIRGEIPDMQKIVVCYQLFKSGHFTF